MSKEAGLLIIAIIVKLKEFTVRYEDKPVQSSIEVMKVILELTELINQGINQGLDEILNG